MWRALEGFLLVTLPCLVCCATHAHAVHPADHKPRRIIVAMGLPPSPSPGVRADNGLKNTLGCLLLLAFVVYANALSNGFVYDDHVQIEENPYVQTTHFLRQALTTNVFSFKGAEGVTNYYRPVMTLSFLAFNRMFKGDPFGFHLMNLLLNCLVVLLAFLVSRRMFGDFGHSFAAALIFAVHPIHTEAVDWIASITELELAFFLLLSFLFYLRLEDDGARRKAVAYIGLVLSYTHEYPSEKIYLTLQSTNAEIQ